MLDLKGPNTSPLYLVSGGISYLTYTLICALVGPGEAARAAKWGGARTRRAAWREARKEIAAWRAAL